MPEATNQRAERVAKSIELLDAKAPADWRERIDPDRLDMKDCKRCILAQVFGTYIDGLQSMSILGPVGRRYAFEDEDPNLLREEWKRRLQPRAEEGKR